jgi:hypothetical protein
VGGEESVRGVAIDIDMGIDPVDDDLATRSDTSFGISRRPIMAARP